MAAATKARTEGDKRRAKAAQKALQAACPISGVKIAASQDARPRRSEADTEAYRETLAMRCRVMRWPVDDEHLRRARDARYETLYGKLAMDGRLDDDGCEAIERFQRVDREYRRHVLGANIPRPTDGTALCEDYAKFLSNITTEWMDCQGVIGSCAPDVRGVFWMIINATADVSPHDVSPGKADMLRVVAHAFGRHFGLMQ